MAKTRSINIGATRIWRNVWGVLALLSLGWICYGFTATGAAVSNVVGTPVPKSAGSDAQTAQAATAVGATIGGGLGIAFYACSGGVPFLLFLFAYSRAGAAIRQGLQHQEMMEAIQKGGTPTAMLLALLAVLVMLGLNAAPARAQATATPQPLQCDAATVADNQKAIDTQAAALKSAAGDPAKWLAELGALQEQLSVYKAKCDGLYWDDQKDGFAPVLGPIDLGTGLYKATGLLNSTSGITSTVVSGDCNTIGVTMAGATDKPSVRQTAFKVKECVIMMTVTNYSNAPWSLRLEPVGKITK